MYIDVSGNSKDENLIEVDERLLGASMVKLLDTSFLQKEFSDDTANRMSKALSKRMFVYPQAKCVYQVQNYKTEDFQGDPKSEYAVSFPAKKQGICECGDFLFNVLAKPEVLAERCKHLWRVHFEIKVGNIPPVNASPYDWLLDNIETRLFHLMDTETKEINEEEITRLKNLRKKLKQTEPHRADYEEVYKEWWRINEKYKKNI